MFKNVLTAAVLSMGLASATSASTVFTENFEDAKASISASLLDWTVVSGTSATAGKIATNAGLRLAQGQTFAQEFNYNADLPTFGIFGQSWVVGLVGKFPNFLVVREVLIRNGVLDRPFFPHTWTPPKDNEGPSAAVVPVPAAGFLLLAALGGLGFVGRRRRAV